MDDETRARKQKMREEALRKETLEILCEALDVELANELGRGNKDINDLQIDGKVVMTVLSRLVKDRNTQRQLKTDHTYMINALIPMLGPKGRLAYKTWEDKGVVRIHHSWVIDPMTMDGEEVAQHHLNMEEAITRSRSSENLDEKFTDGAATNGAPISTVEQIDVREFVKKLNVET